MSLDRAYAERLRTHQTPLWKRALNVQAPYRWNLRRLKPGRTLDVGCGIGRNLAHLGAESVGVDPNEACVVLARAAGHVAFSPEELPPGEYDTLLFSHVLEHIAEPAELVRGYLPRLKAGGQVIFITPQERGYASDTTHLVFLDFAALERLAGDLGLAVDRAFSFPFPRWAGRLFTYNEFVLTARKG